VLNNVAVSGNDKRSTDSAKILVIKRLRTVITVLAHSNTKGEFSVNKEKQSKIQIWYDGTSYLQLLDCPYLVYVTYMLQAGDKASNIHTDLLGNLLQTCLAEINHSRTKAPALMNKRCLAVEHAFKYWTQFIVPKAINLLKHQLASNTRVHICWVHNTKLAHQG